MGSACSTTMEADDVIANGSGVAWVYEEREELEDGSADALGLFSAHYEGGEDPVGGPQAVAIEEALAWARAQAPVVVVQVAEEPYWYSAGRRQPPWPPDPDDPGRPSAPLPTWPQGRRLTRRPVPELLYLRRTAADAPVPWDVVATVALREDDGTLGRRLADELARTGLTVTARDQAVVRLRMTMTAPTHVAAEALAVEACRRALEALDLQPSRGSLAATAYPAGSKLARVNFGPSDGA